MNTFNVPSEVCKLESRIYNITFERLLVFMNPFNMDFECIIQTKALLADITFVLLEIFMNTFNMNSKAAMIRSGKITKITFKRFNVFMH
jgi:hypothetical protein